jgi:pimeloyl-ACP methyl ester carboxylesterase
VAETLAGHFEQAEVCPKAMAHYLTAAEQAKERYNYSGGVDFCRKALAQADKDESLGEARVAGLVLLGDLLSLTGDVEGANESYDLALEASPDPREGRPIAHRRHEPHSLVRDGGRIFFYEHGGGDETLVLAHPLVYGLAHFQPVIEQLCQEFRIVTVDLRGTGRSDPLTAGYTVRDHREDVRAVIEAAAEGPVVAVGSSASVNLMLGLAATYPALVKSLVLVAPGARGLGLTQQDARATERYARLVAGDFDSVISAFWARIYWEPGIESLAAQAVRSTLSLPRETVLSFFGPESPEDDLRPLLPLVRAPALLMRGTADAGAGEAVKYLLPRLPGSQLHEIEGRGHPILATATTEVCTVLRSFLRTGSLPLPARPAMAT